MIKTLLSCLCLLSFHLTSAQVDSSYITITKIKSRLDAGADFCEMVRLYSNDLNTIKQCGEIGFFGKGELMHSYEDAMLKLKIGEISDIIKTGYGYHIIQLIDVDKKKYSTRHILIKY